MFIGSFVTEPPTQEPRRIDQLRNERASHFVSACLVGSFAHAQDDILFWERPVTELPTQGPRMTDHGRNEFDTGGTPAVF